MLKIKETLIIILAGTLIVFASFIVQAGVTDGYLNIHSEDGIEIYINEEFKGVVKDNILTLTLSADTYKIIAKKEGYTELEKEVEIEVGKVKDVKLEFEKKEAKSEKLAEDDLSGTLGQNTGDIYIYSVPVKNLDVYVDNKYYGTTNRKLTDYSVGDIEVTVKKGEEKLKETFKLSTNQKMYLRANFITGEITEFVRVSFKIPKNTELYIEGDKIKKPEEELPLIRGKKYRLKIPESDNFLEFDEKISFQKSGIYDVKKHKAFKGRPKIVANGSLNGMFGDQIKFKVEALNFLEGDITYQIENLPTEADFDKKTGEFSWQTDKNDIGNYLLRVTVKNGDKNLSKELSLNIQKPLIETVLVPSGKTSSANGKIRLAYDILMGKYETTHTQYIEFLNDIEVSANGSYHGKELIDIEDKNSAVNYINGRFNFKGSEDADKESCPVIDVTWYGAIAYCNWLSEKAGLNPAYDLFNWKLKDNPEKLEGYRLPRSKEWVYAARGGRNGKATIYSGSNDLDEIGWYQENTNKTMPVGKKEANELGLYDMSGNVSEWIDNDSYRNIIYSDLVCGGTFISFASDCEASMDSFTYKHPNSTRSFIGFRPVRTDKY